MSSEAVGAIFTNKLGGLGDDARQLKLERERHEDCAAWLTHGSEWQEWSTSLKSVDGSGPLKQALWIRGSLGTGKTTAMCRAREVLHLPFAQFRVVSYFCTASGANEARPKEETILRSLVQKLSLKPDLSVDKLAQKLHQRTTEGLQQPPTVSNWRKVFEELVSKADQKIVVLIDALDECDSPRTLEGFSKEYETPWKDMPFFFLCSSRYYIQVETYLPGNTLHIFEVTPKLTEREIGNYIDTEVEYRRNKMLSHDSIFYETRQETPLQDMKDALKRKANGIRDATKLLEDINNVSSKSEEMDKLAGLYERLWDSNCF
ncbi:hypothetical protein BCR34DRAFT_587241 [Clohesyomyces aquaticus]|uniref:Nephrocystin 3-like N-terminal domain-containing protein n=1 Tax=Clohesyomyces aquaticus TaxID=1231657 RepID=A0A1Y1ZQC3_9PLEO|nr:hypothetical protein BCR34DRAFT_587241 [Clohesyomyces aquaticus]